VAVPLALPTSRPKAIVASATKVEKRDSETRKRQTEDWQTRALSYIYLVPELNFGSRFYSRMLKKVKIFPAILDDAGVTTRITEGPPVDILNRIQDPGGGLSSILGSYGRLMFITGEGYLLGVDFGTPRERWQFVWNNELTFGDSGQITWKRKSNAVPKEYSSSRAEAYRFWMPAPDESGAAESPMRGALEIAEELVLLGRAVRATAVSRMLQGILKIPAELSFGSEVPGADADPEANPYLREMLDHITGVIETAGSAEAAMPLMTEGAMEFLAGLDWMKIHDPATDYMEQALRTEAITRLSYGLDMPPEALKGMTDSNHWTAKQVMHDMWRSHGAGVAEQFCDDLSDSYLRPALIKEKYEGWDSIVVGFDDSEVVISPDRGEDAKQAIDRPGIINRKGYRTLSGIPDDMKPDEEETQLQIALRMRDPGLLPPKYLPAGYTPPSQRPRGPVAGPNDQTPAEDGPPEPTDGRDVSRKERSMAIQGAAKLAMIRCRGSAGAKLRTKFRVNGKVRPDIAAITGNHPNHLFAAIVGRERIPDEDPLDLVQGSADDFLAFCKDIHIEDSQAKALAQVVEVLTAKSLFEHRLPDLPSGFAAQVTRAVEVSEAMEQEIVDRNNEALRELHEIVGAAALGV
jgi:hypothetical protein